MSNPEDAKPEKPALRSNPKPPFSPYDVVIVGLDDHPGIAADTKEDKAAGITAKEAERRRKLYVQLFDERAFLPVRPEFLESVRRWGIRDPITYIVFNGVPYAVNGRQRLMAGRVVYDEQKRLGIEPEHVITVPAVKYDGDIDQLFAVSRVLNIHVDEPPMMKARSINRLLMEDVVDAPEEKAHKRTIQEVAAIYGCSDQHIRDMCDMFKSSDTVKKALEELKAPTIGMWLSKLTKDDGTQDEELQAKVLEELKADAKVGKKITVDRAKGKIAAATGKVTNSPKDKVEQCQREFQKLADKFVAGEGIPKEALLHLDTMVRALWAGHKGVNFPKPIKDQKPGYALDIIAKLGD